MDISSLPTEILDPPTLIQSELANEKASEFNEHPILPLLPAGTALRTHLYPLSAALPEEYLSHPLTLLPEIRGIKEYISELLGGSATLVQVILLLRASVSPSLLSRI